MALAITPTLCVGWRDEANANLTLCTTVEAAIAVVASGGRWAMLPLEDPDWRSMVHDVIAPWGARSRSSLNREFATTNDRATVPSSGLPSSGAS